MARTWRTSLNVINKTSSDIGGLVLAAQNNPRTGRAKTLAIRAVAGAPDWVSEIPFFETIPRSASRNLQFLCQDPRIIFQATMIFAVSNRILITVGRPELVVDKVLEISLTITDHFEIDDERVRLSATINSDPHANVTASFTF